MTYENTHHGHSSAIRFWKCKEAFNYFGCEWEEGKTHELISPHEGFEVSVRFTTFVGHPEFIRIRSTNWRCEYEPNGAYRVEDARALYKQLKSIGMIESKK